MDGLHTVNIDEFLKIFMEDGDLGRNYGLAIQKPAISTFSFNSFHRG